MGTREYEEHKKEVLAYGKELREDCLRYFDNHRDDMEDFYEESGYMVPIFTGGTEEDRVKAEEAFKLDVVGRYIHTYCFEETFEQYGFTSQFDGIASGNTAEIKLCFYPFEDEFFCQNIIDCDKVDDMPDNGHVIYIYPNFKHGVHKERVYSAETIKKEGKRKNYGGQTDNHTKKRSKKPEYWIKHTEEKFTRTWRKNEKKS